MMVVERREEGRGTDDGDHMTLICEDDDHCDMMNSDA